MHKLRCTHIQKLSYIIPNELACTYNYKNFHKKCEKVTVCIYLIFFPIKFYLPREKSIILIRFAILLYCIQNFYVQLY